MEDYDAVAKDDYQRRRFMKLNKEDLAEVAKQAINERDALRAQVAELVEALKQYADPMNWGYRDEGGCEKGHGRYEDACFVGREIAEAAIAAAERKEGE